MKSCCEMTPAGNIKICTAPPPPGRKELPPPLIRSRPAGLLMSPQQRLLSRPPGIAPFGATGTGQLSL